MQEIKENQKKIDFSNKEIINKFLIEQDDDLEDRHTYVYTFKPGTFQQDIIILRYEVLFGFRLRAGIVGLMSYNMDICCGSQLSHFEDMMEKVVTIMSSNPYNDPFKGIPPFSKIKPYFKDDEFLDNIEELYQQACIKQNHTHANH